MKAHLRQLRLSPKKANLVASMVRRMKVEEALQTLKRIPKKGAEHLYDVIHSAASNAEQNDGQQRKDLYIKELIVNKGPANRRYIPIARGRSRGINKYTSHITVRLGVDIPTPEQLSVAAKPKQKKPSDKSDATKPDVIATKKEPVLKAEAGTPTAHVPGNPEKKSSVAGEDPHSGGSKEKQTGKTFTTHRQGSRGS